MRNIDSTTTSLSLHILIVQNHRTNSEENFRTIMEHGEKCVQQISVDIKLPRLAEKQKHRSNVPCDSIETYYRRSLFIPYLDSLNTSLCERFSEQTDTAYLLFQLHPTNFYQLSKSEYSVIVTKIEKKYGDYLENFTGNALVRFAYWKDNPLKDYENLTFFDLYKNTRQLFIQQFLWLLAWHSHVQ